VTGDLPDEAYVVALLSLGDLFPARLAALMGIRRGAPGPPTRSAAEVWGLVRSGRAHQEPALGSQWRRGDDPNATGRRWAAATARMDIAAEWRRYAKVRVDLFGSPGYPAELAGDAQAPLVLYRGGSAVDLGGRRAAIVGTRRATTTGREIAIELGRALTEAGVRVISGLALGIDGAAHEGALSATGAPPIGVVAGGFDQPYPSRHRTLWAQVAGRGCLVSEAPLGTPSQGWRFPARNRIIAALAEVVESRATGGSMITVDLALERGVPVMAVPGSIRSAASEGSNALLRDGAIPMCEIGDALLLLGVGSATTSRPDTRRPPTPSESVVLEAVGWEPTPTDRIVSASGLPPAQVVAHLTSLEIDHWLRGGAGWWQRV
jgi:DNA processing protein